MWNSIREILAKEWLDVTVGDMLATFLAVLGGFVLRYLVDIMFHRLKTLAEKTRTTKDDILLDSFHVPIRWAAVILGVYLGLEILPLPQEPVDLVHFVQALGRGMSIFVVIWAVIRLNDRIFERWAEKAQYTDTKLDDQAIPIVRRTMKVFLIILGISLFLQNMGYSVGSLIAGLGIGGAAIALASKDTLANVFGAIVIFWDRPFEVGDWIEMGDIEGTVEEVGVRTTRIRTFANSQITLPNSKLTTSAINNWSRMKKRRIKMTIGVPYNTSPEKVRAAVDTIRALIQEDPAIHNDFYLVNFDAFGPSSLNIFVYCFTVSTVWAEFLQAKEDFMLSIMERFQALGIEFAFPTQTLHIASLPPGERPGQQG